MNTLQKRRLVLLENNQTRPAAHGFFVISGEKIQIRPLNDWPAAETHLPGDSLPTLQTLERDYIQKVLGLVGENRTRAAAILGIDRVSLWRKIKKYAITPPAGAGPED